MSNYKLDGERLNICMSAHAQKEDRLDPLPTNHASPEPQKNNMALFVDESVS